MKPVVRVFQKPSASTPCDELSPWRPAKFFAVLFGCRWARPNGHVEPWNRLGKPSPAAAAALFRASAAFRGGESRRRQCSLAGVRKYSGFKHAAFFLHQSRSEALLRRSSPNLYLLRNMCNVLTTCFGDSLCAKIDVNDAPSIANSVLPVYFFFRKKEKKMEAWSVETNDWTLRECLPCASHQVFPISPDPVLLIN